MSYAVLAIPPWQVRPAAIRVWNLLERACSRGADSPPEAHIADCLANRALLWIIADDGGPVGVCVTRREERPDATVIEVTILGGYGLAWAHAVRDRLHEFRIAEGADRLVLYGRRGWSRVFGLRPTATIKGQWMIEDFGS